MSDNIPRRADIGDFVQRLIGTAPCPTSARKGVHGPSRWVYSNGTEKVGRRIAKAVIQTDPRISAIGAFEYAGAVLCARVQRACVDAIGHQRAN